MSDILRGGRVTYGQLAGILMLESPTPRAPADPGHAETFPFPVRYGVVRGFPFQDQGEVRRERVDLLVEAAREPEREGVCFVAADCELFAPFQREVADALSVPFLGSSLSLVPFLQGFLPSRLKIGVITGDTRLLKDAHLEAAAADRRRLVLAGMEDCPEFQEVIHPPPAPAAPGSHTARGAARRPRPGGCRTGAGRGGAGVHEPGRLPLGHPGVARRAGVRRGQPHRVLRRWLPAAPLRLELPPTAGRGERG